jgi:hypothetical protein
MSEKPILQQCLEWVNEKIVDIEAADKVTVPHSFYEEQLGRLMGIRDMLKAGAACAERLREYDNDAQFGVDCEAAIAAAIEAGLLP